MASFYLIYSILPLHVCLQTFVGVRYYVLGIFLSYCPIRAKECDGLYPIANRNKILRNMQYNQMVALHMVNGIL